jgi:hypothetical protein
MLSSIYPQAQLPDGESKPKATAALILGRGKVMIVAAVVASVGGVVFALKWFSRK